MCARPPAPSVTPLEIAALRIAELDDEARQGAMHAEAIVESTLDQIDDVRHRSWRLLREGHDREGTGRRLEHEARRRLGLEAGAAGQ
jgi:hypothetical protein